MLRETVWNHFSNTDLLNNCIINETESDMNQFLTKLCMNTALSLTKMAILNGSSLYLNSSGGSRLSFPSLRTAYSFFKKFSYDGGLISLLTMITYYSTNLVSAIYLIQYAALSYYLSNQFSDFESNTYQNITHLDSNLESSCINGMDYLENIRDVSLSVFSKVSLSLSIQLTIAAFFAVRLGFILNYERKLRGAIYRSISIGFGSLIILGGVIYHLAENHSHDIFYDDLDQHNQRNYREILHYFSGEVFNFLYNNLNLLFMLFILERSRESEVNMNPSYDPWLVTMTWDDMQLSYV